MPTPQEPHAATRHQGDGVREPWWSTNFSVLVLLGMFLFTALFVPAGWIKRVQEALPAKAVNVHPTFDARTAELDAALEAGDPVAPEAVTTRRHDLMLRRMLRAGPMSEPHMVRAKRMLSGFDAQLESEAAPAGRHALRHAHARKLAAAFPRLDGARLADELDAFAAQYERATRR